MCSLNLKLEQLEAELQDLNSQESKDEASLAKVAVLPPAGAASCGAPLNSAPFPFQVRKQMRDLEAKVKDQEEELDEQAGTIQMLEQVHVHAPTCTPDPAPPAPRRS